MNKLKMIVFGHRTNAEYWIPIKDVVITYDFQLTRPHPRKFWERYMDLRNTERLARLNSIKILS